MLANPGGNILSRQWELIHAIKEAGYLVVFTGGRRLGRKWHTDPSRRAERIVGALRSC